MGAYIEEEKLVGTGAIGSAGQGVSVKLSEDGNFLFIGGNRDNNNIGAVWFYQKIDDVWTEKQKIIPTGNTGSPIFGSSITVNPSMTTLIVGAYHDNSSVGASFVFTFDGTTWTQQDKLVGNGVGGSVGSIQGYAVALSADTNTAIVGGPWDGNYVGAAWIFVRSGNTWSQQGAKLVGTGYSGVVVYQGWSVAITSDGNLAVVGGYNDQTGIGAIWVYFRSGVTWNQLGTKIIVTGEVEARLFGFSLALSGDDQTLVVGGNADNSGVGAAWIYKRNGNTFTQFGNKLVGIGGTASSGQGIAVAMNKLGTLVAAGAQGDSNSTGAVFVYFFNGTNYNQLGNKIVTSNALGAAEQGYSVALDGSGLQLLFSGPYDNGTTGAAWIYTYIATAQPSVGPTTHPSFVPTIQPSIGPTTQPSREPTTQPSVEPTKQPSVGPTSQPSFWSTTQPSVGPTTQPSVGPSQATAAGNALFTDSTLFIVVIVVVAAFAVLVACIVVVLCVFHKRIAFQTDIIEMSSWLKNPATDGSVKMNFNNDSPKDFESNPLASERKNNVDGDEGVNDSLSF